MVEASPLRPNLSVNSLSVMPITEVSGVSESAKLIGHDVASASTSVDGMHHLAESLGGNQDLDPARANVLRTLDFSAAVRVLEVGCRWGTLTRYLGDVVPNVDAVDVSADRAWVAHSRCLDQPSVAVHVGDAAPGSGYDVVLVSDPIAAGFDPEDAEANIEKMAGLRAALRPGGVLAVISSNRLGVKYLAGGADSLLEIHGQSSESLEPVFSVNELVDFMGPETVSVERYAIFPDPWSPRVVMDTERLEAAAASLVDALPVFPSPDPPGTAPRVAQEEELWRTWVDSGRGDDVANAALIVASWSAGSSLWHDDQLARYWSVGRRAAQTAENVVRRTRSGVVVERGHRYVGAAIESSVTLVDTTEPFRQGVHLVTLIADARDITRVGALLGKWRDEIAALAGQGGPVLWDLAPHNVLIEGDQLWVIDQEWVQSGSDWSVVLRRGIFWLVSRLAESGQTPDWLHGESIAQVATQLGALVGLPEDGTWLETFFLEESEAVVDVWRADPRISRSERAAQFAEQLRSMAERPWGEHSRQAITKDDHGALLAHPRPKGAGVSRGYISVTESVEALRGQLEQRDSEMAALQTLGAAKDAEIARLTAVIESLEAEGAHIALMHRDHSIGLEAQLATTRAELDTLSARLRSKNQKIEEARRVARRRGVQIEQMRKSSSWRVGNAVMKPMARVFRRST